MKAIIVEDEFLAQEELRYLVEKHSRLDIVATFDDELDVLRYLQNHEVDVVFLDINIPSLDGVLLAQSISKFVRRPAIIFITAYKEHAVAAFELEAFDYILKPYHEQRIVTMLHKLEAHGRLTAAALNNQGPRATHTVNLMKDERIIVTDINNLYYAVAQEKVTQVYTRRDVYTMPIAITEFCARLPEEVFFRCNRSYVVNREKIREIVPWFNNTYLLRLNDVDFEVPVSRGKVKAFRLMMGL
ncbi:response regulator transcription factor [Candidatus Sodalis endolongispinus]|uniref:Response regulator transcription factor n=1 Tax=Candidatus Sodalis endolongispinus TaxID=2812662 RepID=A0ABS5Y9K2_9GAMM|nr:LytTR family DNA-binding domain-containing protein [Candidatus Sodalis endolongispinus]MBT9431617.1 response regulator transcription factor [Candidatus Sodalis endolongispinus]